MKISIDKDSVLEQDTYILKPIGSTSIQPPSFPGLGSQTFRRNGVNYTNIATKASVVNQLESSLVSREGYLMEALDGLPHLAVVTEKESCSFAQRFTTAELPHRIGSGVFAFHHKASDWDFSSQLLDMMNERGPYNAIAYFDPISALFGCFLSHYPNIPSRWSRITGSVIGGCIASHTQQVISAATTKDPLGANSEEIGFLDGDKTKASSLGMGNIVHLQQDISADSIELKLFLTQSRLKFYEPDVQDLLVHLYQYSVLKTFSDGFDFRNRCFLKPVDEVIFDEKNMHKLIQNKINTCKKAGLINDEVLIRTLPLGYIK